MLNEVLKCGGFDKASPHRHFDSAMPFKNPDERKKYMKQYMAGYLAEFRAGKRRTKPSSERVCRARASKDKMRKRLWELENHERRMAQQRERRHAAREGEARGLLRGVAGSAGGIRRRPARFERSPKHKQQQAA